MPDPKRPTPPSSPAAPSSSDPARSGSFVQRTLSKSVQALDATALRLRRLQMPPPEQSAKAAAVARSPAAPAVPDDRPSGRIAHDSRGNAVWKWAAEASALALESTSMMLKKLEVPELKVEEEPQGLELEEKRAGGGYDPYNRERRGRR